MTMINKPFSHNYFIGYVNHVDPQYVKVHFPSSVLLNKFIFSGEEFNGGLVGNFITIEGESYGFIGKLMELDLPEKERLGLSEKAFQSSNFHPTAKVEILLSFDYFESGKINRGLDSYPNIGAKVYACPSEFIQKYLLKFGQKPTKDPLLIDIGTLVSDKESTVEISQQAMFSRHCAIVGTTGGGKSWSVAKLIESMAENHTKCVLIDPTGEYSDLACGETSVSTVLAKNSYFHYRKLTIDDLFFLVKPAGRVQSPKLLEAIRSLKAVELGIEHNFSGHVNDNRVLIKTGIDKLEYGRYYHRHIDEIENGLLTFDITKLPYQVANECIWDSGKGDRSNVFGDRNDNDLSNCTSLISRIKNILDQNVFRLLFGFNKTPDEDEDLTEIINKFLNNDTKYLLRIGFEEVGFESQSREIVANAIGKFLLNKSRLNCFKEKPLVLFIDEAHQFLNNKVVDDYFGSMSLSAFDQIAKECRKYGLFLCIATQMPRDIPVGTLSQMGTFLVHRLINFSDKESIKQACSSANSGILSFLPVLGEGEAILTGVDFPMPLTIKVAPPKIEPDSKTPQFTRLESV